jgi:hypothetical protein
VVEARSYAHFGVRGVPGADALGNLLVLMGVVVWLMMRGKRAKEPAAAGAETYAVGPAAMEPAGLE